MRDRTDRETMVLVADADPKQRDQTIVVATRTQNAALIPPLTITSVFTGPRVTWFGYHVTPSDESDSEFDVFSLVNI